MAGEIQCETTSGATVYAQIRSSTGTIWSTVGVSFGTYAGGSWANYDIAMTEQGTSGIYVGDVPAGINTPMVLSVACFRQVGGSPAQGDPRVAAGSIDWHGSAVTPVGQFLENILTDTQEIGINGEGLTLAGGTGVQLVSIPWNASWDAEVESEVTDALTATVADSIPADGTRPSIAQAVYMIAQYLMEKSISGTTMTIKKPDGSTTLMTLTLNSATAPTSVTRAT